LRFLAVALLASSIIFWMLSQALAVIAFLGFLEVLFFYRFKKTAV
jgi:hypothetical protein